MDMRLSGVPDDGQLQMQDRALVQLGRALERFQPIVEFDPFGTILRVNRRFVDFMGFNRGELVGQHHRILCDPAFTNSDAYVAFWAALRAGEPQDGEFRRIRRDGREVWIRATYAPLAIPGGEVTRIIKLAMDITESKMQSVTHAGLVAAIDRSMAVIEFDMDGNVLGANPNYLSLVGYSAAEIIGCGHEIFCPPGVAGSQEYQDLWTRLRSGAFAHGTFQRVAKGGRTVWIEATYNPVPGLNGAPAKIVKFAMDVTASRSTTAGMLVDAKARSISAVMQMLNASTFSGGQTGEPGASPEWQGG